MSLSLRYGNFKIPVSSSLTGIFYLRAMPKNAPKMPRNDKAVLHVFHKLIQLCCFDKLLNNR